MARSEKRLAEKMKVRLSGERDRQRRWRMRQLEKGCKSIAGMVSLQAYEILQKEKARTGERVSDILERAILALSKQGVHCVINNEMSCATKNSSLSHAEGSGNKSELILLIEDLRIKKRLPFNEIARRLNESGYVAPTGQDHWEGRQVYDLFKQLNIEDKPADSG